MIAPGSTIGVLGGGQLGRMLAIAAANLGYRTHVYAPGTSGPATEVAARWTCGAYGDADAVAAFAAQCDVVTYEFENVDLAGLARVPALRPGRLSLEVAQDRLAEKSFARRHGGTTAAFAPVDSLADLRQALRQVGCPAILKTRRFGYDGKGQERLRDAERAEAAWLAIGERPAILERMVPFEAEFSIILARDVEGAIATYPAATNRHRDGILETSTVPPAGIVAAQAGEAAALAARMAEALDHVGVLACEFFATADGPVFNEMAPRVHNSGHWSIEGALTSQFENHVRAICGLPLGSTALAAPGAEMVNLIGSDWEQWPAVLAEPGARLHLYGKGVARPGRKMGHVTRLG